MSLEASGNYICLIKHEHTFLLYKTNTKTTKSGCQMLMKMGWSGGGVGRVGNKGITEPVELTASIHRQGLGSAGGGKFFKKRVELLISSYMAQNNQKDLVFLGDFLKEERAIIHGLSSKHPLKSKWHGRNDNLVLVLSKRRSASQLLSYVQNNPGVSKYLLIPPSNQPSFSNMKLEL